MTDARQIRDETESAQRENVVNTQKRVDAAHVAGAEVTHDDAFRPAPEVVLAATGALDTVAGEQMLTQARQLGALLRTRERHLSRREAEINARVAQIDNEARTARLLLMEEADAVTQQREHYEERLRQLAQREAELANAVELGDAQLEQQRQLLECRQRELDEQAIRLEAEENRLRTKWESVQARREADMQMVQHLTSKLEERRALLEQEAQQLVERAASGESDALGQGPLELLAEKHRALDDRQQKLDSAVTLLEQQRQQIAQEHQAWETQKADELAALQQHRQHVEGQLNKRREQLDRRSRHVASRLTAAEQLQTEVTKTHRQALEMRLVTEQLWRRLTDRVGTPEVEKAAAQLRRKLAEQHRAEAETLAQRRQQLRELTLSMREQHEQVRQQRQQLKTWFDDRQSDMQDEAARLAEHARELAQQQLDWQEQRQQYEAEIKTLKQQLRSRDAA